MKLITYYYAVYQDITQNHHKYIGVSPDFPIIGEASGIRNLIAIMTKKLNREISLRIRNKQYFTRNPISSENVESNLVTHYGTPFCILPITTVILGGEDDYMENL